MLYIANVTLAFKLLTVDFVEACYELVFNFPSLSNSIGPVLALWFVYLSGTVCPTEAGDAPVAWIIAYGCLGIVLGLWILGRRVIETVGEDIAEATGDETLAPLAEALEKALGQQQAATMWFMQNAMQNPNHLGAGAHHYMHIMGIVTLGWMWLRMAKVAQAALAVDARFVVPAAKLTLARP